MPACPTVRFLRDADKVTVYRPGPGQDITDILYEAKLTGLSGDCEYVGKDGVFHEVVISLRVKFDLVRGPADLTRIAELKYFVAIPEFFPAPEGKRQFVRRVRFPPGRNNITITDDFVEIRIPLTKDRKGPGSRVYIGFHLTQDQLNLNRRQEIQQALEDKAATFASKLKSFMHYATGKKNGDTKVYRSA